MTPDERALLQRFLQDLVQSRAQGKDAEADSLINDALRSSPDAAYLLVQHAILSDQALHAAQGQIAQLQQQLAQQAQAGGQPPASFLGGGNPRPSPWGQPQPAPAPQPAPNPWGQSQPAAPPPAAPPYMGGGPFSSGSGLGNFLRQAGTTAAGVAGGEMLFSGLSGLFGGHPFGGGGFGGGGYGMAPPVEETVVNNYYDDNGPGDGSYDDGSNGGGWDDDSGSGGGGF